MAMLRYCLVNCRSKKNLRLIEKDIVVDKVLINKYSLDFTGHAKKDHFLFCGQEEQTSAFGVGRIIENVNDVPPALKHVVMI